MKCVPLVWPGDETPRQTFVIHKREAEVLLDVPNKNPLSQWLILSFGRSRVYVCDGHRLLVCSTAFQGITEGDEHHIPIAQIKAAHKTQKMTTALLVAKGGDGYRVAAVETGNKDWDLFGGETIAEVGDMVYDGSAKVQEMGAAVPRIESMEKQLRDVQDFAAGDQPTARRVNFRPSYLATFGKMAKLTKDNDATMFLGGGALDPALFMVEDEMGECSWLYVLMPMKPRSG